MEVTGYKAFYKDMTNRHGVHFEIGETYQVEGEIRFGINGNGFHMCKHLCDVFRYFEKEEDILVVSVTGSGKIKEYDDLYYGYYEMYAVEKITINRILAREEILQIMMHTHDLDNKKFLATFDLTEEEKKKYLQLYRHNKGMLVYLLYYQFGYKEIYEMSYEKKQEIFRKVLING